MKKPELLAPAGNLEKLKTAFLYGADAVYLGIPDFSLRVRINDFDFPKLIEGIKYAHDLGKKVYVTINIFAHQEHLKKLPAYLKQLKKAQPDALIISDPGIIQLVKKNWPEAEIHLSTQANCTNAAAAQFWFDNGVSRIVLGREVTLSEIKEIHRAVPKLELEYFIHGAMCMAYSGRCFLSKEILNRSGNLGDCAQPCRFEYSIKAKNHEQEFDLISEEHGTYLLNSKDLCLIRHLQELKDAGIVSFKIEGRAKSVYYQALVCGIYRRALQAKDQKELNFLEKELKAKLVNRGYTTGFLLNKKAEQNNDCSHYLSNWEFCGQVIKSEKGKIAFKVHNTVKVGDDLELILPAYDIIKIKPKHLFLAKDGTEVAEAHGGGGSQVVLLNLPKNCPIVPVGAVLCRKKK